MRNPQRREILCRGLKLLGAVAALPLAVPRASAAAASCVEPDSQPLRESLHYADVAPDAAKACTACGFFTAEERQPAEEQKPADQRKPACGNCMIFSGPVNATGHCDSWSMKS
jgi:hypothetical protein